MRHFTVAEAKNLSHNEIMAIVCEGLAEVAEMMANDDNMRRFQSRQLLRNAEDFRAFGRFWQARKGAKPR